MKILRSAPILAACAVAATLGLGCDKTENSAGAAASPSGTLSATGTPTAVATPTAKTAPPEGKVYGAGVAQKKSVSIAEIIDHPERYDGKKVRVEGVVTDVCPHRGCWFKMDGDNGKSMLFKVEDDVMVFPTSEKGKYAVAEGVVSIQKRTLEEARKHAAHLAEEKGEKFDPASVTEPTVTVRLDGTGAAIRDNK